MKRSNKVIPLVRSGTGSQAEEIVPLLSADEYGVSGGLADGRVPQSGVTPAAARARVPRRRRLVGFAAGEQLETLVDTLQMFAVLWCMSQPWPWPQIWLYWTRWITWINLDFHSAVGDKGAWMGASRQTFSPWGETQNYLLYALFFMLVPVGLALFWRAALARLRREERDVAANRAVPTVAALRLAQFAYLPVLLAVSRLMNCDDEEDGTLSADPSVTCWSTTHALFFALGCATFVGFGLGLPLALRRIVHGVLVHRDAEAHERYLCQKEAEYVLCVNDEWQGAMMGLTSSFRRPAAQYHAHLCFVKLALVLIFACLRGNLGLQAGLYFCVVLAWSSWHLFTEPFRTASSNFMATACHLTLVLDGMSGVLTAYEIRSAFTVATTVAKSLMGMNAIMFVAVLAYLARTRYYRETWPVDPSLEDLDEGSPEVARWIALVREANSSVLYSQLVMPELVQLQLFQEYITQLRRFLRRAKAQDHVLAMTLSETLAAVELFLQRRQRRSMYPSSRLEPALLDLSILARRRTARMRLLTPTKRSMLLKLLAVRAWLGGRRVGRLSLEEMQMTPEELKEHLEEKQREAEREEWRKRYALAPAATSNPKAAAAAAPAPAAKEESDPELAALEAETTDVLRPPIEADRLARLKDCRRKWRARIKLWEEEFQREHGRPAEVHDKAAIRPWYESYRRVQQAGETVKAAIKGSAAAAASAAKTGVLQTANRSAEAAKIKQMTNTTELLLQPPIVAARLVPLEQMRKQWKHMIKGWEQAWRAEHAGEAPAVADKAAIRPWYENYRRVQKAVEGIRAGESPAEPPAEPPAGAAAEGEGEDEAKQQQQQPPQLPDDNPPAVQALRERTARALEPPISRDKLPELEKLRKKWKAEIKGYEEAAAQALGRALKPGDKKRIKPWYEAYQKTRKAIALAQKLSEAEAV